MTKLDTILTDFNISNEALVLFVQLASDAGNWNGQPLLPDLTPQGKGFLTDLKKKGLVSTFTGEGCQWVNFEARGEQLAEHLNIQLN